MAINLMGNYRIPNEQDLTADLIEEAIEQRGVVVRYIVRDTLNPDYLLGESSMSEFTEGYQIPMYLESVEHFNGNGDIFDAFGISKVDSSIFQVAVRRFKRDVADSANIERPREGDLIYMSLSDSLWEISKVKMDQKYYQMGKNYTYRLVCKLFSYSHEVIDNPESDVSTISNVKDLDDEGLKRLIGINPDLLIEEQDIIQEAEASNEILPDSDTFGF